MVKNKIKVLICGIVFVILAGGAVFLWKDHHAKQEYIFLMSGVRDHQDFPMFQEFEQEIQRIGGKPVILDFTPGEYSGIQQIKLLNAAVDKNTVCIIVNAAAFDNLSEELKEYQKQGIKVISYMNKVDAQYRNLHIGTLKPQIVGECLFEEVYACCPKDGSFLIISDSAQAEFLTTVLMHLRYAYEEENENNLLMADIIFGNNDDDIYETNIENAIHEISSLDVIVCLSERATQEACKVLKKMEMQKEIQVIGVGVPELLSDFFSDDEFQLKSFYNDKTMLGIKIAQIAYSLVEGEIEGNGGEVLTIDGMEYMIEEQKIGDSEVYLYSMYQECVSIGWKN